MYSNVTLLKEYVQLSTCTNVSKPKIFVVVSPKSGADHPHGVRIRRHLAGPHRMPEGGEEVARVALPIEVAEGWEMLAAQQRLREGKD